MKQPMEQPPFSKQNRPWMTDDCIADMNQQWVECMAKIKPEHRDALGEWAAVKVETGVCHDDPKVREQCRHYGDQWMQENLGSNVFL